MSPDDRWMQHALRLAEHAELQGEIPVGAVVVRDDVLLGEGWNRTISDHDPSAHAEIVALRAAGSKLGNYRMPGCRIYVTLEPCAMCLGALLHARLDEVCFAASDPKTGALGGSFEMPEAWAHNHRIRVKQGVLAEQAGEQLRTFFRKKRKRRD